MRKSGVVLTLAVISILMLSLSFTSASWLSDFWGKITGEATANSCAWGGKAYPLDSIFWNDGKKVKPAGCRYCASSGSSVSLASCQQAYANGNCRVFWGRDIGGTNFVGTNNTIGFSSNLNDTRFLCLNNKFYECGWELNDATLATKKANGDVIGSYKCDLANKKWTAVSAQATLTAPSITAVPASCQQGFECSPQISLSITPGTDLELFWIYDYADGTRETICLNRTLNANSNCSLLSSDSRVFVANLQSPSYSFSANISNPSKIITNVDLKIALWNGSTRSSWSSTRSISITTAYGACTNECNNAGQKACLNALQYRECGNYDSDACLEWSSNQSCTGIGAFCNATARQNQCQTASYVSCLGKDVQGRDLFCYLSANSPVNSLDVTGFVCPSGQSCYTCAANYTWNSNSGMCEGVNTCILNRGICSAVNSMANATLNIGLNCNGLNCFICNQSYHAFNNSCTSNACIGLMPVEGNGTIIGPNSTTTGSNVWTYNSAATNASSCQWKCDETGYHKNESTNNTCILGAPPCSAIPGCKNEVIANAFIVSGGCDTGYSCYQCNSSAGYNWNGSTCSMGVCLSGQTWNGIQCINQGSCEGCVYEDNCLREGFRINIRRNSFYCSSEHTFLNQKADSYTGCNYNYECKNNYCSNSTCVNLAKMLESQSSTLKRIWCWINSGFSTTSQQFQTCLTS